MGINSARPATKGIEDLMDSLIDIREHDVPYHMRVAIDNNINIAKWYDIRVLSSSVTITERPVCFLCK